MKKKKNIYEEDFFEGIFKHAVGEFTKEDLEFHKKWFYGWYKVIENTIPFKGSKKKHVLEIGCSLGASASILEEKKFNVLATDVSSYAVKHARKLNSKIRFRVLDIRKPISIRDKFDYIIGFEVIEHIKNPLPSIKYLREKLVPGGYLILSSPPPFERFWNNPTHVSLKSEKAWVIFFRKAGFKDENILFKKVTFLPVLWKYFPRLNYAFPFHVDIRKMNSTTFYFLKK